MNRQRLGLWGTFVFSALAVIGVLVQVYLIGGFLFGESGWLDTHRDMGKLVHLFYVLTFVSALVAAWPDWRKTGWPFALAALGTVQAFLAGGSGFEKRPGRRTARIPRRARPDRLRHRVHDRVAHLEDAPGHVRDHRDGDDLTRLRHWRAAELRPCAAGGDA